jgi:hypothetical protein
MDGHCIAQASKFANRGTLARQTRKNSVTWIIPSLQNLSRFGGLQGMITLVEWWRESLKNKDCQPGLERSFPHRFDENRQE